MPSAPIPSGPLSGRRLLIVEDEYLIAADLESALVKAGATVVGPAATLAQGLAMLDQSAPDAAILDINLDGQSSAPIAAVLLERGVPFILVTGYGGSWTGVPEFRGATVAEKPVDHRQVIRAVTRALAEAG